MTDLAKREIKELIEKSYGNRLTMIKMLSKGVGHIGGAFSSMDILTVLYNKVLNINPENPAWEKRDIFLLSAAHKAVGLYAVLQSVGYFQKKILDTYNDLNTIIPTHPDASLLPGIDFSFGSLGHGLSVGVGIALASRLKKIDRKVFVLMGDAEACEGSVWEAVLAASTHKLDSLIVIIDVNKLSGEGFLENNINILPYEDKYRDFGWSVRTIEGHNIYQIYKALIEAPYEEFKPTCIVANTIKAKGVDFCENRPEYHYWTPNKEEIDKAIHSLQECKRKELNKYGC
jgi:transketolase